MIHETERLILRPWQESDAESLYEYAKDPQVGPAAGWPVHISVEHSREVIRHVLSAPETYAVVLKSIGKPVGSIGLMIGSASNLSLPDTEAEIGYWIGVPFWGQGLIPEAVRALQRYAFETMKLETLWCGHFVHNEKSRRAQEKCGFAYHHTLNNVHWPLIDATYDEHITCLPRERWQQLRVKPAELRTERLILRPAGMKYLNSTYEYTSDPENTRFMTHLPNASIEECADYLAQADAEWAKPQPGYYEFAILLNGEHIGGVSLFPEETDRTRAELGWIIHKKHWGKGIVTEAARALIRFAADALHISHFIAHCDSENAASYRVMEKLGMTRTGERRGRKNRLSDEDRSEYQYEMEI